MIKVCKHFKACRITTSSAAYNRCPDFHMFIKRGAVKEPVHKRDNGSVWRSVIHRSSLLTQLQYIRAYVHCRLTILPLTFLYPLFLITSASFRASILCPSGSRCRLSTSDALIQSAASKNTQPYLSAIAL